MTKQRRTSPCTAGDARTRLRQAETYLAAAEMINDVEGPTERTVATGNAVLAAIAAADAMCCAKNQVRFRGENHREAADFLSEVTQRRDLGDWLRSVVDLKDAGHYGLGNVSAANTKTVLRNARKLVEAASGIVR
jgi:hypothetical protein